MGCNAAKPANLPNPAPMLHSYAQYTAFIVKLLTLMAQKIGAISSI
ncbi:hypothetical protein [Pseudorhodobacter wandonensis]|nr:hypothetical protein [Pseudorhodobacter wandonensis]